MRRQEELNGSFYRTLDVKLHAKSVFTDSNNLIISYEVCVLSTQNQRADSLKGPVAASIQSHDPHVGEAVAELREQGRIVKEGAQPHNLGSHTKSGPRCS